MGEIRKILKFYYLNVFTNTAIYTGIYVFGKVSIFYIEY